MIVSCAIYFLNPTMQDKVMVQTLTGSLRQTDFWRNEMFFHTTHHLDDDNFSQIFFISHNAGQSYGLGLNLEHKWTNTHAHGQGKLYMPFHHFSCDPCQHPVILILHRYVEQIMMMCLLLSYFLSYFPLMVLLRARVGWPQTSWSPPVILLLAVPRQLFCFSSLVVLDVVFRYLSLFLLYINIKIDFKC